MATAMALAEAELSAAACSILDARCAATPESSTAIVARLQVLITDWQNRQQ